MGDIIAKSNGRANISHTSPKGYTDQRKLNWEVEVEAVPVAHGSGQDYCAKITVDNIHLPYLEDALDRFAKQALPQIKKMLWEQINQSKVRR
jgi:hypothetical protein